MKSSEKKINVTYQLNKNGFDLKLFSGLKSSVSYPPEIIKNMDKKLLEDLTQNFIYCRTRTLTFNTDYHLNYQFPKPFFKKIVDFGINGDLPHIADTYNINTSKLKKSLKESDQSPRINFDKNGIGSQKPLFKKTLDNHILIAMSFGKDSLLTYALAKELGLKNHLVFVNEMEKSNAGEYHFKKQILKDFSRQEKIPVYDLSDDIDEIHFDPRLSKKMEELESTNGMLALTLELLPYAVQFKTKYILFGNEKNLDDFYFNRDKVKTFPSFDQTTFYTRQENSYLQKYTSGNIKIVSLIEPLYNLAEMKIIYHRYPYLLQYLMSCYPPEHSADRWCYSCPMCAKAFLYSAAVGGDPKAISLKKNMFESKYKNLYPLFTPVIKRAYEKPPAVREEQLLSFLLAYGQGWRGGLIDLFKKRYLNEASRKEKMLRKKFFSIHAITTIPKELRNKLIKIYQEELKDLT